MSKWKRFLTQLMFFSVVQKKMFKHVFYIEKKKQHKKAQNDNTETKESFEIMPLWFK